MKKTLMALVAALGMLVAVVAMATPAHAQEQTITSDPASVEEAGEHELTVTGAGYTGPAFLLPCPGAGGDPTAIAEDSCDTGALTPVTPDDDGNWEATVTFDIPAEGLVMVAGNAAQTEVGATVVMVGAMEEAMEESESMEDDSLADTGNEAIVFALVGLTALMAGVMFLNTRREFS